MSVCGTPGAVSCISAPTTSPPRNSPPQRELFAPPPPPVVDELQELDLDDMTPRQAVAWLREQQRKLEA